MDLKGLRVMVTGGAGFIGSHLVDQLIEMGNQVVVYDNFDEYYMGKEKNISHHLMKPEFKLIRGNILDYSMLLKSMNKVDLVFHLAAQAGVRYSQNNPVKTNTVNTNGTLNVLNGAKANGLKKVVFASTSSVYGVPEYLPIDEKHPTNPISVYGASKLAAEKFCQIYADYSNLSTVILRYHTVYGPRQRPDMAIHKWTKQLYENKPPIIYGDGEQTRDFTYIADIIEGTIKAAQKNDLEERVFNLGFGSSVTVNETVKLIQKQTDKTDVNPVFEPPKLGDTPHTHADISRARRILKYNPKVNLKTGIHRFVDWTKMFKDS